MTYRKPLTASERYARFVLAAWDNKEFTQLTALLQTPHMDAHVLSADDRERIELTQDMVRGLLEADGCEANTANVNTTLALVRHLAGRNEEKEGTKSPSTSLSMSLLFEKPVCAPRSKYVR
jgi:hypothetical protein